MSRRCDQPFYLTNANQLRFRWAACQIDYMCELHTDKQRKSALGSLPPTLPKTYERILSKVNTGPLETQKMVQRALLWIAYAERPLSLAELTEILSIEENDKQLDPEAVLDNSAIMTSCSSLIRTTDLKDAKDESLIEFSHFTVKEYLLELRKSADAELRRYSLASEDVAHSYLAKMCLTYLSMDNFGSSFPKTNTEESELIERLPFRCYAVRWIEHRDYGLDESYVELSRNLFNPSKSYNFMCWATALATCCGISDSILDKLIDTSTLHWACIIADPLLCSHLIKLNENVNKWSRLGTPLHCAVLGLNSLVDWLDGTENLNSPIRGNRLEVVQLLLQAGANVNQPFTAHKHTRYSGSVTIFNMVWDYSGLRMDEIRVIVSALLQQGMVCDRPTLENIFMYHGGEILDQIQLRNLRSADTAWFISEYASFEEQSAPAIMTEVQGDSSKSLQCLEAVQALMMTAAEYGQDEEVGRLLERYAIDVNIPRPQDGSTPLHLCVEANHPRTVELLLRAGADPLRYNMNRKTSLHLAARHLDGRVFESLLGVTADVDQPDCHGVTPLHEAVLCGNTTVINQLYDKFGFTHFQQTKETSDGRSLSLCASGSGSIDTVKLLAQIVGDSDMHQLSLDKSTALHYAAETMSLSVIQYLLACGVDVNTSRMDGSTPFHVVVGALGAGSSEKRSIMKILLDYGANINARRADGVTPLSLFCGSGGPTCEDDLDTLSLLLENTSELNPLNNCGRTPLHLLCTRMERYKHVSDSMSSPDTFAEAICKLLEKGAVVTIPDDQNQTPLQIMFQIRKGRRKNQSYCNSSFIDKFWKMLLQQNDKAAVEAVDFQGNWLLNSALASNDVDLANDLLDVHCDVDKRNRTNELDPIELACCFGHSEKLLLRMLRLSKTPEVKNRIHNGVALLHFAVFGGSYNLVLTLLDHGANIEERTTRTFSKLVAGASALDLAIVQKHNHIVDLLLSKSANRFEVNQLGWTPLHLGAFSDNLGAMVTFQRESLPCSAQKCFPGPNTAPIGKLTPLHLAAAYGHDKIVKHILDAYPSIDIDQRASYDLTALQMASRYGHTTVVELLLSRNADVEAADDMEYTSLQLSIIGGHEQTALVLLDSGANTQRRTKNGFDLEMLALQHGRKGLADTMHEFKAKISGNPISSIRWNCAVVLTQTTAPTVPSSEDTANTFLPDPGTRGSNMLTQSLFQAIASYDKDFCRRLLDAGADANCHDGHHTCCTALISALRSKQPEIAEMLIERGASNTVQTCDTTIKGESISPRGYSALHYAAALGYDRVLGRLLHQHDQALTTYPVTPLHLAAANGQLNCVKKLLRLSKKTEVTGSGDSNTWNGAKIENCFTGLNRRPNSWRLTKTSTIPDHWSSTALHLAVAGDHEALVAYLVRIGIELDRRDEAGHTSLHIAALKGYTNLVRTLVRSGADVNCRTFDSRTPLHCAVHNGHIPVVLELLRHQADLTLVDCHGSSAIKFAIRNSDVQMVSYLLGLGQRIPKSELQGCSHLCWSLSRPSSALAPFLLDFSKDYSSDCSTHGSLLILAHKYRQFPVVRRLLHKMKEQRQLSTNSDSLPQLSSVLCYFCSCGQVDLMEDVLDAGADIDRVSKAQETPLGIACSMGQLNAVKFLVQRGAKTSWIDQRGRNVSAIAKAKGQKDVLDWLQSERSRSPTALKVAKTENCSLIGNQTPQSYIVDHRCVATVFDSTPPDHFGIRRRRSFILEYTGRVRNSAPTSLCKLQNTTQREPMWDSREFRQQYAPTSCVAICKRRDKLLPLRYLSYPLSTHILRVALQGPWEIF